MWTILEILLLSVLVQLIICEEFIEYTYESIRDDNGKPCLTGCSPDTHECIINWKREKRSCKILAEPAPIYRTSQYKDSERKYCMSNCGPYDDYEYDWCFTTKDFSKWDFCGTSTLRSFLLTGQLQGLTSYRKTCTDQCSKGRDTYFWCHHNDNNGVQTWNTCALYALPRIPVLHNNFHVGEKNKGKCDDFFRYDSEFEQSIYSSSSEVPDNYIIDFAEGIEAVGKNTLTQVFTLNEDKNPVVSYSLAKIKDLMVPVVIRAHVTKDTINFITNNTGTSTTIERKILQQMSSTGYSYVTGTLIGFNLGGPNADYNLVPRPLDWKCDDWADMEDSVINWCRNTGGSVDMLIVVFYRDGKTPIPKAFGVSLIFRNADHSVFVDCREKLYWNNF